MTSLLDALHRSEQERAEVSSSYIEPQAVNEQNIFNKPGLYPKSALSNIKFIVATAFSAGLLIGAVGFAVIWLLVLGNLASINRLEPLEPVNISATHAEDLALKTLHNKQSDGEGLTAVTKEHLASSQIPEKESVQEAVREVELVEINNAPKFDTRPLVVLNRIENKAVDLPEALGDNTLIIDPSAKTVSQNKQTMAKVDNKEELDLSQVSPNLAQAFQQAVSETKNNKSSLPQVSVSNAADTTAIPIDELPQSLRNTIPNIAYNSHVYSSDAERRRVKINGLELVEGDNIGDDLELLEITPNSVILRHKGQSFSLEALTDWPY